MCKSHLSYNLIPSCPAKDFSKCSLDSGRWTVEASHFLEVLIIWKETTYYSSRGEPSFAGGPEFWTLLNPGQEKRSNNPLDDGGGRCMYVIMLRANDGFGEPRDKAKQPCLIYLSSTSTKWPFALHQSSLMLWWWWWLAWLQYDNLDFTFSPPTGMKSFLYAQLKDVCKPTPSSSSSSCCQWCLNFVGWVF